jgi:hypothetical protein
MPHWPNSWPKSGLTRSAAAMVFFAAAAALGAARATADGVARTPRHFAVNGNFDSTGRFLPQVYGFDIADVSGAEALDGLTDGVRGLVWVGSCDGADARFRALIEKVIDHPKLFGLYLMDDPDPSGRWRKRCRAEDLRAEADWIHARRPGTLAFVALMNVGGAEAPAYDAALRPENSHVDLFGVAPYPCRRDWGACDYAMIDRFIEAARRIGVKDAAIVPVYQTFGGGDWQAEGGGYRLPQASEMSRILQVWRERIPNPVFDYAYSWGSQKSDTALSDSAVLLDVFKRHNGE